MLNILENAGKNKNKTKMESFCIRVWKPWHKHFYIWKPCIPQSFWTLRITDLGHWQALEKPVSLLSPPYFSCEYQGPVCPKSESCLAWVLQPKSPAPSLEFPLPLTHTLTKAEIKLMQILGWLKSPFIFFP